MPPWGTVLEAKEIDQLVAYVQRIASTPAGQGTGPLAPFDLNEQARIDAGKRRFARPAPATVTASKASAAAPPTSRGAPTCPPKWPTRPFPRAARAPDVMPPWGGAFSEEQIWELVAYLQYLGKQQP